ncbi:metal-dependent hydrolase [Williamsia sp. 1135]|uniref:metal-dependent hydrolase n=1 Tax=Williamsia sp. 1135 TaxID=1889262 RepID=UPI000A112C70|nr:metal-dependent hydrolase [Williamsia sp. 1135]ORM27727.1 metal-dependent hydrolase [Williamsia sp. 1135]
MKSTAASARPGRVETTGYSDESYAITARAVQFDWTDVPLEYIPGEAYATHFWNVMHLVLPEGERAMADVFARALPLIDDRRLHEEVVGFVGQETTHASSHEGFRDYLIAGGVDVDPIMRRIRYAVGVVFGDHGLTGRAGRAWLNERLGIYAAAEHFTAVVGEWLLDNSEFDRRGVDPTMLDLLRWHGAEELEHRNVAFDAFQYVDGGGFRRARTAVIASFGLAVLWFTTAAHLYRGDPGRRRFRVPWPLAFARASRRHLIPGLSFLFVQLGLYIRPGFHPSSMGDIDKAVRYLATSPAALAAQP